MTRAGPRRPSRNRHPEQGGLVRSVNTRPVPWAGQVGDTTSLLRLVTAVAPFWQVRGHFAEGTRWLDAALAGAARAPAALRAAALHWAGNLAAGHGEAGNDLPLFLSTARAERVEGERGESGYRFWGRKQFGSLTPVWTRLGIHATYAAPDGPQVVHAFLPRDTPGYAVEETWDTLGMRATRSDDTVLDGAFVPDRYIARVLPAGAPDLFVLAIFA
jgi:alkylation response protein AidB-like acyl-CoA dehydrogenase